jgi:hypothetical protein
MTRPTRAQELGLILVLGVLVALAFGRACALAPGA